MGQIKMDEVERGVLELKRHLLESEVQLNKATIDQLIMYGVLTTDKAHEIRGLPAGEARMDSLLEYLEDHGKPGVVKALARALTRDFLLVAESLMFEQNLAEGIYADDEQLQEDYIQAGRDIHRVYNTSRRITEGDKAVLQQIIGERFLFAQRVYGRQLMKTQASVSHQQMIGEDLDRAAKKVHFKAIEMTSDLRQKFVSILGSVVQGGSMISGHDGTALQDLFYRPGGTLRKNTPLEELDKQFQEIIRITNRSLIEMDYLKDEKIRILENLGLNVETNLDVGTDVIINDALEKYEAQIKHVDNLTAVREQDRRRTQIDLYNFEADHKRRMAFLDQEIRNLQEQVKEVSPEVADEIENIERLRRETNNDQQELDMWKQTCKDLESGKRLNKIYQHKLDKLVTDSDIYKGDRRQNSDVDSLPRALRNRYDDILNDGKELLRETERILEGGYSRPVGDEIGVGDGWVNQGVVGTSNYEQGVMGSYEEGDEEGLTSTMVKSTGQPKESTLNLYSGSKSKIEFFSGSNIPACNVETPRDEFSFEKSAPIESSQPSVKNPESEKSPRSVSKSLVRDPEVEKSSRQGNTPRSVTRSLTKDQEVEMSPRLDNSSRSVSRAKTGGSGREILSGDQPWGAAARREKTWCAPRRNTNKQSLSREEKRQSRERPWVLSKEKKAILRQGTLHDFPTYRTETSFIDRPKTRSKSEMNHHSKYQDRSDTRTGGKKQPRPVTKGDPTVPVQSDLGPRETRKSRAGGHVSFSMSYDRQMLNNMSGKQKQGQMGRSLDMPFSNLNLDESLKYESFDPNVRPETRVDSVSPMPLGESLNAGNRSPRPSSPHSPQSPTEAWMYTPKSKPTEKEVAFYKAADYTVSDVQSSGVLHEQFIPKTRPVIKSKGGVKSREDRSVEPYGGTTGSVGPTSRSQGEGLEGPKVSQIKARPQNSKVNSRDGYPQ